MVVQNKLVISLDQSVLPQILKPLGLNYAQFARRIGITVTSLERYRYGTRQCRFTTAQWKTLNILFAEAGLDVHDLPDDWIIDKHNN